MLSTKLLREAITRGVVMLGAGLVASSVLAQELAPNPADRKNELPPPVAQALRAPDKVILYSLEPWERPTGASAALHGVTVLGQTELKRSQFDLATSEFTAAVARGDGSIAMCFEPRHAIRVIAKASTYDLLLCYDCGHLDVYQADRVIKGLSAVGSPQVLNAMLTAAKVPLSRSGKILAERRQADDIAYARWVEATPASVKPLWNSVAKSVLSPPIDPLRAALAGEFPDARTRIRALFAWFGSGQGPWSGFPSYESIPETLLFDFSTDELIAAASGAPLSERETEGAARLFAGWDFATQRPEDRDSAPPELKKLLLEHALKSSDADKVARARKAFATVYTSPPISHPAMELIRASNAGDLGKVQLLLAQGAPTDSKDPWGMTALVRATEHGNLQIVQLLLEHGAPVKGLAGVDALTEAAGQGRLDIVTLLLDKGSAVDAVGWRGITPLHIAENMGHRDVVALLLERGAITK